MLENKFLGGFWEPETNRQSNKAIVSPFIKYKLEVRNNTKMCHIHSVLLDIIIYKYLNYN